MIGNADNQWGAQSILGLLRDVFTVTPRANFTREEILVILDRIRSDRDLFDPNLVLAFDRLEAEL
jgi:hypothetical protein